MEQNNIYSEQYPIHSYEIDPQYKATVSMLLKILQESAANHAYAHGLSVPHLVQKGFTWVLVKQLIRILDFPVWKDTVTVETWSKGFRGFSALRDYRITGRDGKPLALGTSSWFIIDIKKRRPARLEQFQENIFSLSNLNALETAPGKIDMPKGFSIEKTLDIRKSDLDMNGHVNNINYADWIFESLPGDYVENYYLSEIEIHYLAETLYGDPIQVRTQFDANSAIHSILRTSDQTEVCRARTVWSLKK